MASSSSSSRPSTHRRRPSRRRQRRPRTTSRPRLRLAPAAAPPTAVRDEGPSAPRSTPRTTLPTMSKRSATLNTIHIDVPLLLDRPFCERSILCFAHVSFFPQLTFSDVCKPTFSKLFHMTWLYSKKKRCYADFLKVPPNKNEGRQPPNFAQSRV